MRNPTGTKRILPAVLAVAALLVALLVAVPLLMSRHGHTGASPARTAPSPTIEPSPVPSGAVTLVAGARVADGVEIGYPHTTVGAISAASAYLAAIASTLDPDYAASLGRMVGDPVNPGLSANLATSVTALRTALQLPANGPVPPRAAFLTTPEMYQLREVYGGQVTVLLLTSNTFINAQGGTAGTTGVYPMRMRWTSGDWHLAGIGDTGQDYSALAASPGTADAIGKGWQPLATAAGAP